MMSQIRELIDKLNYYTKLYDEGTPEISDKEWDDLYFELVKLENQEHIYFEDSPTQRVNYQVVNQLDKVLHSHPMLSLDKTKDIKELYDFCYSKENTHDGKYIAMAKLDGLTCSLRYMNGYLVGAETRGNGIVGEDILHNAYVIKNIPKKINYMDELIIDGEILCSYEDFESFKEDYKNPRNFASGSIRLLDSKECSKRRLSFIAWDYINNTSIETMSGKLHFLSELGFTVVPFVTGYGEKTIEQCIEIIKDKSKSYPIDGLVFKYEFCSDYDAAGRTDHHFKGGLAYKFYDEEYETTLKTIEWTMGRTGVLTPTAVFETIEIDGTEVSRASLHNLSVMDELSGGFQRIGDKLMIYKANQIIPQVSCWEHQGEFSEETHLYLPKECPYCGGETIIKQEVDSKMLYCNNPQCEGKLVNRIEHFFGKKGLDAKGISKATIEKLIDLGWVTRIRDVFDLSRYANEWKALPGFGEKSVSNILGSIDACRNCDLESAIAAIGIPLVGRTVAKDIAERFETYGAFKENVCGSFDFSTLSGYGYEMNKSLKTFNYEELDYIVENYLKIKENKKEIKEQNLKGITFCITGKVHNYKNRDELAAAIEALGGKVVGSMSKNVNYLINNDIESASAKNNKAKELGVPIITEEVFIEKFI